MDKIAKEFQNNHKKGTVSNVTSYSFKYSEASKNGSVNEVVYMKSYFMEQIMTTEELISKLEKVKDKTKPIIFDIWDGDPVYIEVTECNKTVQIEQIEPWQLRI